MPSTRSAPKEKLDLPQSRSRLLGTPRHAALVSRTCRKASEMVRGCSKITQPDVDIGLAGKAAVRHGNAYLKHVGIVPHGFDDQGHGYWLVLRPLRLSRHNTEISGGAPLG